MSQVPPPGAVPPVGYQAPSPQQSQGLAVGALICGIVSVLTSLAVCLWFVSIPLGIVALVLGLIGKGKADRGEAGGSGMAKTGMILGILGILLSVVITVGVYMWAKDKGTELQQQIQQEIEKEEQRRQSEMGSPTTTP